MATTVAAGRRPEGGARRSWRFGTDELFYMGLIFAATFVGVVLAYAYYSRAAAPHEALFVLLLLGALGSAVRVASSHFASFVPSARS